LVISDFGIPEKNQFQLHLELFNALSATKTRPSSPIIFDIGANRGQSLAEYGAQFTSAAIFCFEPNPKLSDSILEVAKELKGIDTKIFALALGAQVGTAKFNEFFDDGVSSFLEPEDFLAPLNSESWVLDSSYFVEVRTIDSVVSEIGSCPDVLKIDTQGFDLEVLKGAVKNLEVEGISIIGVECYFARNYKDQSYFWDLAKFLESYNYHFYSFTRLVETSKGNLYFGDATFLSNAAWQALGLR